MRPTRPSFVSRPSYRSWATRIVRLGLKPNVLLASCCSVDVVNGGGGLRRLLARADRVDDRLASRAGPPRACSAVSSSRIESPSSSPFLSVSPSILSSSAVNRSPLSVSSTTSIVQYSRAREGVDLALALDDEAHGDRLDTPGRQARSDLAPQQRAERVADEPIEDAPRLLRVDEVVVDLARVGESVADGVGGDLGEGHAARLVRR